MFKKLVKLFTLIALFSTEVLSQDAGPVLDLLVEKKIITPADAERARAEMAKANAETPAGKLKLTDSITELKIYGDARLRYQYDQTDSQLNSPSTGGTSAQIGSRPNVSQRSRWRFRLRLNADFKIGNDFFGGVALATGQSADSNNQTFENGFDNYNIFISKVFLGWKPTDWATFIVGKQANPLYTTELVWDADINPTGLVEIIDVGKALFPDSKWSLQLIAGQYIFDDNNEFSIDSDLNTDAYLFVEQLKATYKFNSDTGITVAPAFMSYTAADLTGLQNARAFTDAPALDVVTTQTTRTDRQRITVNYDAAGNAISGSVVPFVVTATQVTPGAGGQTRTVDSRTDRVGPAAGRALTAAELAAQPHGAAFSGAGAFVRDVDGVTVVTSTTSSSGAVSGETREQHILTAPGDVSFKLAGIKSKFYWDFAWNVTGRERFNQVLSLNDFSTRDGIAWLVGLQLGENKKAGDWQAYVNYREIGIASIDPNLNDSDFAQSALNVRGFKLGLTYNLTDWLTAGAAYSKAWNLRKNLVGGQATGGAAIADVNGVDVFQVDLNWKF